MFQHAVAEAIKHITSAHNYIDDIIIASPSPEEHVEDVIKVIKRLNELNLRINFEKSAWAMPEIILLGYRITAAGIKIEPEKLVSLQNMTVARTGKEFEKHLGLFNYFRELIPCYSKIMAPLEKLRKMARIEPSPVLVAIYDKINKILASDLVLSFPDFGKPFKVGTDASKTGIGVTLYQEEGQAVKYISLCTRFVMLKALKDKNQFTVAQSLLETFCTFGFPVILQSDNGTEFVNRVVEKMIEIARTEHRTITAYNPQANGVAERFIGTMANCILKLLKGNSASWEKQVPVVQYYMNNKITTRTGSRPFTLLFSRGAQPREDHTVGAVKPPINEEILKRRLEYI